jgi:hypothetical protein
MLVQVAMSPTDEGLSREITKWELIALFVNVTVGDGIPKHRKLEA